MAQVVKPSAASSDRQVKLHPLVLINISDHYTREKCRPESSPLYTGAQRVAGVLFGVQKGNTVDIYESFEMLYTRDSSSGILKFDEDLLQRKKAQFIEVFPNYEILGWYSTGSEVTQSDLETHKMMATSGLNENPVMLTLDADSEIEGGDALPLRMLETRVTGAGETVFVELAYSIDTLEPERICVDYISKQKREREGSAVTEHTESLKSALDTLKERISVIHGFLQDIRAGRRKGRPALLRRIAALCNSIPIGGDNSFKEAMLCEANDGLLLAYLAQITKVAVAVNEAEKKIRLGASESKARGVSSFGQFGSLDDTSLSSAFEGGARKRRGLISGKGSSYLRG